MTQRRLTWRVLAALLVAMLVTLLPAPALADAQAGRVVHVEVTVGIKHGGTAIMEPQDGGPRPRAYQLQVADGEVGHFQLDFTQVGEYTYLISQVPGDKSLSYDTTPYSVKIYVMDNDGRLGAAVNVFNDTSGAKVDSRTQDEIWAKEACEVYFVNRTTPPDGSDEPDDSGKSSDGGEKSSGNGGKSSSGGKSSGSGGRSSKSGSSASGGNQSGSARVSTPQTGDSGLVERYFVQAMLAAFGLLALSLVYLRNTLRLARGAGAGSRARTGAGRASRFDGEQSKGAGSSSSREK